MKKIPTDVRQEYLCNSCDCDMNCAECLFDATAKAEFDAWLKSQETIAKLKYFLKDIGAMRHCICEMSDCCEYCNLMEEIEK